MFSLQSRPTIQRRSARFSIHTGSTRYSLQGTSASGVRHLTFSCTACEREHYEYWVFVNYQEETWIQKVGQLPIWIPTISKEMESELGEDAELYKKALRNM